MSAYMRGGPLTADAILWPLFTGIASPWPGPPFTVTAQELRMCLNLVQYGDRTAREVMALVTSAKTGMERESVLRLMEHGSERDLDGTASDEWVGPSHVDGERVHGDGDSSVWKLNCLSGEPGCGFALNICEPCYQRGLDALLSLGLSLSDFSFGVSPLVHGGEPSTGGVA